jgi:hypothetical protein
MNNNTLSKKQAYFSRKGSNSNPMKIYTLVKLLAIAVPETVLMPSLVYPFLNTLRTL